MPRSWKITRAKRAQIRRRARELRLRGQAAGWGVPRIVAAMLTELPEMHPLEAWRFANGWSRPEVIAGIAGLYERARLAAPPLNSSMLCRWEHGDSTPSPEYADALCRLYQARPDELGLPSLSALISEYPVVPRPREGDRSPPAIAGADRWSGVSAVRASVRLALAAEGSGGGPMTLDQLEHAARYYDMHYAAFPPALLAPEVHYCRDTVTAMLDAAPPPDVHQALLGLAARLSALLGNLAFHLADRPAAEIHLGIATGLATTVGDRRLRSWSLAARSMVALAGGRPERALRLAHRAVEYADEPLHRAQAVAWAELPAQVRLRRTGDARDAMLAARRAMDASLVPAVPGRFGFDQAELELHLAEAALGLGDLPATRAHAAQSLRHTGPGRPGWAAVTLVLARGHAAAGNAEAAAELGSHVLDVMPPETLRSTTLRRLAALDRQLATLDTGGSAVADLSDRLHMLRQPETRP